MPKQWRSKEKDDLTNIKNSTYIQNMTTVDMLMKEIETMPEEITGELLDFAISLKTKKIISTPSKPKVKSMFGAFPGIQTDTEREEDRV